MCLLSFYRTRSAGMEFYHSLKEEENVIAKGYMQLADRWVAVGPKRPSYFGLMEAIRKNKVEDNSSYHFILLE